MVANCEFARLAVAPRLRRRRRCPAMIRPPLRPDLEDRQRYINAVENE
nr:hypothetical protein asmbl_27 [uncultured bacterium]